jgi:regulator of sigma E protease
MADFFSHPIPAVILLLGILVLVHEAGHFIVGRWCGIAVEIFSIGFGPRIFGFTKDGTEYRVSWIPLGGFVKFAGAHPSEDVPFGLKGAPFRSVSLTRRALTVAAGPAANFLLAILVYTVLGMNGIQQPPAEIGEVVEGSPAAAAGLQFGDKVLKIGDADIANWRDLEKYISSSPDKELEVVVARHGKNMTLELKPAAVEVTDITGRKVKIGRAGVALGRLPAIVTVLNPSSVAAQAGIRTGDRITSIRDGEKVIPVQSFPELAVQLQKLSATTAVVSLKVHHAPIPKDGDDALKEALKTEEKTLQLSLAPLQGRPEQSNYREQASALGLEDSQLTIADATGMLKGVLRNGDVIVSWEGNQLHNVFQLGEFLRNNDKPMVDVGIQRAGKTIDIKLALEPLEVQKPEGKAVIYTFPAVFYGQPEEPQPLVEKYSNPLLALGYGLRETAVQTGTLFVAITNLIKGEIPIKALGGPMLIAKVAGDSARHGWQTFVGSLALISINLGLLNLFPIPVLDGGQLVLMGAEAVRRRPLREAAIENFQKVGFAMILALVVLATYNDLSRFWKSMLESVVGMFQ